MAADPGERDALLDRDAHIRPAQHERQMVYGRGDHRIFERRHKRGPSLASACARQCHLDLVSPLARYTNNVSETERRRQHRGCLGCERGRHDIHPDGEETNDARASGRFHLMDESLARDTNHGESVVADGPRTFRACNGFLYGSGGGAASDDLNGQTGCGGGLRA
jgi:hypothetical protein